MTPRWMPRWGKVGKQKVEDEGPLPPFPNMTDMQNWQKGKPAKYDRHGNLSDQVLVGHTNGAMDKAKADGKPFFIWHNTTRMHVFTYLPPKYQAMMNLPTPTTTWKKRVWRRWTIASANSCNTSTISWRNRQHHRHLHHRQWRRSVYLAGRRNDPVQGHQRDLLRRWLPRARDHPLARKATSKPGTIENGIFSGLDWFPTLVDAAGNPDIANQLLKGA